MARPPGSRNLSTLLAEQRVATAGAEQAWRKSADRIHELEQQLGAANEKFVEERTRREQLQEELEKLAR